MARRARQTMTLVGVVDRSSPDVRSLGRKMIERSSEQKVKKRGGGEVEGIERDSRGHESEIEEREK